RAAVVVRPVAAAATPLSIPVPMPAASGAAELEHADRRERRSQLLSTLLLVVAIGFLVWLVVAGTKPAPRAPSHPRHSSIHPTTPASTRSTAAARQTARLVLTGAGGHGSWVELRRDSSEGPVIYAGVLPAGGRLA